MTPRTARRHGSRPRLIAVVLAAAALALPAAAQADDDLIPAGEGCAFDILYHVEHKQTPAADHLRIGFGQATITNPATGASVVTKSRYTETFSVDEVTNTESGIILGRRNWQFYPGDQGPFGVVVEEVDLLRLEGRVTYTFDFDADLFTAFTFSGGATDICAMIAGT